jgi:hypothetical protein
MGRSTPLTFAGNKQGKSGTLSGTGGKQRMTAMTRHEPFYGADKMAQATDREPSVIVPPSGLEPWRGKQEAEKLMLLFEARSGRFKKWPDSDVAILPRLMLVQAL